MYIIILYMSSILLIMLLLLAAPVARARPDAAGHLLPAYLMQASPPRPSSHISSRADCSAASRRRSQCCWSQQHHLLERSQPGVLYRAYAYRSPLVRLVPARLCCSTSTSTVTYDTRGLEEFSTVRYRLGLLSGMQCLTGRPCQKIGGKQA